MTPNTRQSGSVYLPVLIASMVAATLAVGGMLAVRTQANSAALRSESSAARMLALSAVEIGRARIAADKDWRDNLSAGTWLDRMPMGNGTISLDVTSPAGPLDRNPADPVVFTGTGRVGRAVQVVTATLSPSTNGPLSSLTAAIGASGNIDLTNAVVEPAGMTLSANGNVSAFGLDCLIHVDVRAKGSINGILFTGQRTAEALPLEYPESDPLRSYIVEASALSYSSLPLSGSTRAIFETVLSPTTNPYGPVNSRGIYVIDCNGGELVIMDSRIVGTLVVINASSVRVEGSVNWNTAEPALPALLVDAPLTISLTAASPLDEGQLGPLVTTGGTGKSKKGNPKGNAWGQAKNGNNGKGNSSPSPAGVNLNPSGTPYPYGTGTSDSDVTDTYPTQINGLVYASGNVDLTDNNVLHTLLCPGNLNITGTLTLIRDDRYITAPPPGFTTVSPSSMSAGFR